MRRVVVYPGRIAVEAAGIPVPGPDPRPSSAPSSPVCADPTRTGRGQPPLRSDTVPPGHEVVGVIEAAGSAGGAPGQRVIVEPDLPCWTCKMCTRDARTCARTCSSSAAATLRAAWPTSSPWPRTACTRCRTRWTTPPRRSSSRCPRRCTRSGWPATFGPASGRSPSSAPGTIGLFTLAVLRAHGAGKVVSTDPNLAKRQRAEALGADVTVDARAPDITGQVREALGGSARHRLRLRRHPVVRRPGDRHRRQGRDGHGGRRPGRGGHRPAADRAGPPDPHPGQRHLPARGLRRIGRPARPGCRPDLGLRHRYADRSPRSPRPSSWPRRDSM